MTKVIRNLVVLAMIVSILSLQGCTIDGDSDVIIVDDADPADPRGVYSVTGDEEVLVIWYPNQEKDLAGYVIYRSLTEFGDYDEIDTVGPGADSYVDDDVQNGITYFYAVSAFDDEGNESDLSPDVAEDTPRPAGRNVKLEDFALEPDLSGFDFSRPGRGAQAFDIISTDIYFGFDTEVNVPYIYSDDPDVLIQDLGYTDDMDDIDVSPTQGFTTLFVEAIIGHTYTLFMPDGHYAKIRVSDMDEDAEWMIFEWAFQLQQDNPDLAPARN